MLNLNHISASYQENSILEDISLNIEPQRFHGLIGPNGAGKTTLLKIMTGIKKPDKGEARLNNSLLEHLSKKQIAKTMAVVPQSSFIPPAFTVEEVVAMGRYPFQGLRFSDTLTDIECVAAAMGKTGMNRFGSRLISELSGGQRQEVIIARALAQTPQILMLDEPTSNLDIKHQMKILRLTAGLVKEEGMTAVMVIHDLNLAARFCDSLVLLHNKKILAMGEPKDVLTPSHLKTAYEVDAVVTENSLTHTLDITVLDSQLDSHLVDNHQKLQQVD